LLIVGFVPARAADEDKDLELIPQAIQQPLPAPTSTAAGSQRNYLEDAFSAAQLRGSLAVPFPPPAPANWEDRLFLDTRDAWQVGDGLTLTYSGRFNLRAANDLTFPGHENILNELREAFVSWQPADGISFDLGRVNIKSGVAIGFNPTDFFKTRAVVEPLTADPTVLREDRLGTLMLSGQYVWAGGAVTLALAPGVTRPSSIYNSTNLPSFNPMLDRTNAEDRFLLKASVKVADGLDPEVLLYHAGNSTQIGANLTAEIGQQTVGYLEWAGGMGANLINNALRFGQLTGTLPANEPPVIPNNSAWQFQNALSVGFSWTPSATKLTFNLEYHFNQAGFSAQDWHNWFNAGARQGTVAGVDQTLWYIRSYALDQQEPLSRHTAFLRADWVDAFVPDLEMTALANVNLLDGSGLVQATADYYVSRAWTVGGLIGFTFGGRHSEFGSLPQSASILIHVMRYL
jgi:hypothetical protein